VGEPFRVTLRDRIYRLFTARSLGLKAGERCWNAGDCEGNVAKCAGHKIGKLG
jgi:hypothetical protein